MRPQFQLQARTGHPDFLDLPWGQPLVDWVSARLVQVVRGIGRHVVRFVADGGRAYALKETSLGLAEREYGLLRALAEEDLPAFYRRRTVLGVNVFPEDVAEAIAFFAGPRAAKSTGNVVNVDGGVTAAYPR